MASVKIKTIHILIAVGAVAGIAYWKNIGGFKDKVSDLIGKPMKEASKEVLGSTSEIKPMTGQPIQPGPNVIGPPSNAVYNVGGPSPVNMPLAYSGYRTRYYNPRAYAGRRTGLFQGIEPHHAYFGATEQSEGKYNAMPTFEFDYRAYPTP